MVLVILRMRTLIASHSVRRSIESNSATMRTYTTMPAKNLRARVRRACAVHVRGWHVHMHRVHGRTR